MTGLIAIGALALVAAIAVVGMHAQTFFQTLSALPPAVGTRILAPSESKVARSAADPTGQSAQETAAARYLAAQPTAYWLTPELEPVDEVSGRIARLASEARAQHAALAVVVYGLPGRDCGNHSAGGLDPGGYIEWTDRIGQALRDEEGTQKIVVLEPDSLAMAPECGNVGERSEQLAGALGRLAGVDTWIYLDGGHSDWLPAQEMADLIAGVGLNGARGFATNVSNFQRTADEFDYAHEVARLLGEGAHAIIDTSRNGAGPVGSQWCNPPGRLVGDPGGTYGDLVVDTNLWIKPPGESDGPCNGGPNAGQWWPAGAVQLTTGVR